MSSTHPSLGRQVYLTYRAARSLLESLLVEAGYPLPLEAFQLLNRLFEAEGGTQNELAEQLAFGKTALTRLVDKLEAEGLVERRSDTQDRRSKRIFLTPQGRQAKGPLRHAADRSSQLAGAGLSDAELKEFFRLLDHIRSNLEPK
ncbi:MAG: MarR family transcriptional regulator [bacterium]|nr:MarR family transcriptional regulator [bacterium]